jgi:hypothetical protein
MYALGSRFVASKENHPSWMKGLQFIKTPTKFIALFYDVGYGAWIQ